MRKSIGGYILRKKFSKLKRKIQVFNLQTAKRIGIVYFSDSEGTEEEIKGMISFLEKKNIKVQTVAMVNVKSKENLPLSSVNNFYFNKQSVNFYKIPTSTEVQQFIQDEFDILIDCNFGYTFPLKYVSSLSKAKFKVGPSGGYHKEVCDLTISMADPISLKDFLEQTKHYLQIIDQQKT